MPSKEKLAHALLESYFNIRKEWWNLVDGETNQLNIPEEGTKEYNKLKDSMDVLSAVNNAAHNGHWLKIIYTLHDIELKEQATHDQRWLLTRMIVSSPLMMDVMRAIREVIINDADVQPRIKSTLDSLAEKQKEIEVDITRMENHRDRHPQEDIDKRKADLAEVNKKIDALNGNNGYRDAYFEVIKSKDPKSKELGEESFQDFANNVEIRQRKSTLTQRLLEEFNTINGTKSALQQNSTFTRKARRVKDKEAENDNHHTHDRRQRYHLRNRH